MLNVGLTGGIASGKSTVARMLAERGAVLIDFDRIAHALQAPGEPVWREIVRHFGREILRDDRSIDRRKLGALVFADRDRRELLNRLVHPAIFAQWRQRLAEIARTQPSAIVVTDIPLLFEAGLESLVDLVLLVYAPPGVQLGRLIERDGLSPAEARERLASQMPIDGKLPRADIVIRNDGPSEATCMRVGAVWEELRRREAASRQAAGRG